MCLATQREIVQCPDPAESDSYGFWHTKLSLSPALAYGFVFTPSFQPFMPTISEPLPPLLQRGQGRFCRAGFRQERISVRVTNPEKRNKIVAKVSLNPLFCQMTTHFPAQCSCSNLLLHLRKMRGVR